MLIGVAGTVDVTAMMFERGSLPFGVQSLAVAVSAAKETMASTLMRANPG
jgi:hypothetical protein